MKPISVGRDGGSDDYMQKHGRKEFNKIRLATHSLLGILADAISRLRAVFGLPSCPTPNFIITSSNVQRHIPHRNFLEQRTISFQYLLAFRFTSRSWGEGYWKQRIQLSEPCRHLCWHMPMVSWDSGILTKRLPESFSFHRQLSTAGSGREIPFFVRHFQLREKQPIRQDR